MEYKFKTKITRRGKLKEVEITFNFNETEKETVTKDIKVIEDGKEIRNYSVPSVINAIQNFTDKL